MFGSKGEKSQAYHGRPAASARPGRHLSAKQKRDFVHPTYAESEDSKWLHPEYEKKPELLVVHDPDRTIVSMSVAGVQQVRRCPCQRESGKDCAPPRPGWSAEHTVHRRSGTLLLATPPPRSLRGKTTEIAGCLSLWG